MLAITVIGVHASRAAVASMVFTADIRLHAEEKYSGRTRAAVVHKRANCLILYSFYSHFKHSREKYRKAVGYPDLDDCLLITLS
jgi:hypothetical protein